MTKKIFLVTFVLIFIGNFALADVLCVKKRAGITNNSKAKLGNAFTTATSICPAGYKQIINTATFSGPAGSNGTNGSNGSNGADGADGSLRIYGDGSAGSKSVTSSETLADSNLQYSSFSVASGHTLTVPSGTVIRSSGTCNIEGTISVGFGAHGGRLEGPLAATNTHHLALSLPGAGHATLAAQSPEVNQGGAYDIFGGFGGRGVGSEFAARQIRFPGINAGGGGASAYKEAGTRGGGSLVLLCKQAINISATGSILANGDSVTPEGGGGAGGIIILASPVSIISLGLMEAKGSPGGDSTVNVAPSGGGGGGIIHILSPSAVIGNTDVAGGTGGIYGTAISATLKSGGAGGGACGGDGGNGSDIGTSPIYSSANAGDGNPGYAITTLADPTSLF